MTRAERFKLEHVAMIRRLARAYRAAPDSVLLEGRAWYPAALRAAESMAIGSGLSTRQAVGVIAALSPRTPWPLNLEWADAVTTAAGAGAGPPSGIGLNGLFAARAWRIATDPADPLEVLRGPKVCDFYRAILGAADVPVVDRWAARSAGHDRDGIHPALYHRIRAAYVRAADVLSIEPRTLQATLWVAERGAA